MDSYERAEVHESGRDSLCDNEIARGVSAHRVRRLSASGHNPRLHGWLPAAFGRTRRRALDLLKRRLDSIARPKEGQRCP